MGSMGRRTIVPEMTCFSMFLIKHTCDNGMFSNGTPVAQRVRLLIMEELFVLDTVNSEVQYKGKQMDGLTIQHTGTSEHFSLKSHMFQCYGPTVSICIFGNAI